MPPEPVGEAPDRGRSGLSVVVCTRNRAQLLAATIDSLLAQEYPRGRFEVIVIDNASSDGTHTLLERCAEGSGGLLSWHLERRPGTAHARNLGAERARYDYVAYLDDDTRAPPGWLAAYDRAIRLHGLVAGGGPVWPVLEPGVVPPAWWAEPGIRAIFGLDHAAALGSGDVARLRWPLWLGGCNAVYLRALLFQHGCFSPDTGPVGGRYRVAEDIELNARLERAGVPIHYVPDARIEHRIPAARLQRRFIWMRSYAAGITNAAAADLLGQGMRPASAVQLARA